MINSLHNGGHGSQPSSSGNWSSLIGIVTAICGNILISLALNTQRYAHIRMSRDLEDREEAKKLREEDDRRRQGVGQSAYGTLQAEVAEHRAKVNLMADEGERGPGQGVRAGNGYYSLAKAPEGSEGDALLMIPRVDLIDDPIPDEKLDVPAKEKSYLKSPIWWAGIGLMTAGEAGNFLAYGFCPASIVSPLGVVALVSNCLIAPLLLGEQFRVRDGVGVIIAIAGCVTVVLSASGGSDPRLTPDAMWDLILRWEFLLYLCVTVLLIVLLALASNRYGDKTALIDLGLVGLLGGYTVLSTKGIASLLSNTIWHVVTFPITYLLLLVLIFTAVMQIKYVNRALQHFDATVVIPTQFVLFTLSVIIGSAVLYRDFERESAGNAAKFFAGCALTFFGVWCITSGRSDDADADEEFGEAEDAINLLDEENMQPEIRERQYSSVSKRASPVANSSFTTQPPVIRRRGTAESIPPNVLIMPNTPSPHPHARLDIAPSGHLQPANSAAIHFDSMASLPSQSSSSDRRQQLHATASSPSVPTTTEPSANDDGNENSLLTTRTPLNRYTSSPATQQTPQRPPITSDSGSSRHTPHQQQQNPPLEPTSRPPSYRHPSVAGLLPGPLTSPLSSSLSAIVADSLRRGFIADSSSPLTRSLHRRPSQGPGGGLAGTGARRRLFPTSSGSARRPSEAVTKRHSVAFARGALGWEGSGYRDAEDDGTSPSSTTPVETGTSTTPAAQTRAGRTRSLSATLGDFFTASSSSQQRKRQRLEREESAVPEVQVEGPAGEQSI